MWTTDRGHFNSMIQCIKLLKLLNDLLQKLVKMYKCTIGNDLKENPKSSFQFNLISCIYIIFVNIKKQESRFFIVITVLRKWAIIQKIHCFLGTESCFSLNTRLFVCSY